MPMCDNRRSLIASTGASNTNKLAKVQTFEQSNLRNNFKNQTSNNSSFQNSHFRTIKLARKFKQTNHPTVQTFRIQNCENSKTLQRTNFQQIEHKRNATTQPLPPALAVLFSLVVVNSPLHPHLSCVSLSLFCARTAVAPTQLKMLPSFLLLIIFSSPVVGVCVFACIRASLRGDVSMSLC